MDVQLAGLVAQALQALQAGAISAGLPFTIILLVCCVSLWKGLREDHKALTRQLREEKAES